MLAIDRDKDIAGTHPCLVGRATLHHGGDQGAFLGFQAEGFGDLRVMSCGSTPIQPRVTEPVEMIDSITCLAVDTGMAKPIPSEPPERE